MNEVVKKQIKARAGVDILVHVSAYFRSEDDQTVRSVSSLGLRHFMSPSRPKVSL